MFYFAKRCDPESLVKLDLQCPEQGELHKWPMYLRRSNIQPGFIKSNEPIAKFSKRVQRPAPVRHSAVHRNRSVPLKTVEHRLKDCVQMAEDVHDTERSGLLSDWLEVIQGAVSTSETKQLTKINNVKSRKESNEAKIIELKLRVAELETENQELDRSLEKGEELAPEDLIEMHRVFGDPRKDVYGQPISQPTDQYIKKHGLLRNNSAEPPAKRRCC